MVAAHHYLATEIAYDPDSIVAPANPSNSDKLAQRNLAFVGAPNPCNTALRQIPQTLEIKPTLPELMKGIKPGESMIEWNMLPTCSFRIVYAGRKRNAILTMANTLYIDIAYPPTCRCVHIAFPCSRHQVFPFRKDRA